MEIYTVKAIYEADYGCEDTGRKEPMALLKLIGEDSEEKNIEVSEAILAERGISEGKKVCFTQSGDILKYIRVVAAVIFEKTIPSKGSKTTRKGKIGQTKVNEIKRIFATARGYGEYKGWWEFPGGKIEAGETPQQALEREIREELTAKIRVGELIRTVEYDYPKFHLSMDCFWAEVVEGQLVLKEAEAARWLTKEELDEVNWLPADEELVGVIRKEMGTRN